MKTVQRHECSKMKLFTTKLQKVRVVKLEAEIDTHTDSNGWYLELSNDSLTIHFCPICGEKL